MTEFWPENRVLHSSCSSSLVIQIAPNPSAGCYKHPGEIVLERPGRLDMLSIPGLVFLFIGTSFPSPLPFLHDNSIYTLQISHSLVLVIVLLIPWCIHDPGLLSVLSSLATAWPIILLCWCIFSSPSDQLLTHKSLHVFFGVSFSKWRVHN